MSFFFNDTAPTEIYTLSLHDALPIWQSDRRQATRLQGGEQPRRRPDFRSRKAVRPLRGLIRDLLLGTLRLQRSEEHTSELQSHVNLVCRLLLEKKKQNNKRQIKYINK